jgi:Spy/CpxP family protein refolding chaperone
MTRTLKWWFALALVVVFAAGLTTGLFAGARHGRRVFVERHGAIMGERMREHLRRELQLTPEQEAQVGPVLERAATQLRSIREETQQRVAQTMNQSHQEIAPMLTAEQRERLDRIHARHVRIMRRRHFGPPHQPPP